MGLRLRKSVKLPGGFKINLSKSGVGYSWGIPGYRITQTAKGTTRRTYSIPGTGLSWVEEDGRNRNRDQTAPRNAPPVPQRPLPQETKRAVEREDLESYKTADISNISTAIEKALHAKKIATILSVILILCGLLIFVSPFLAILPVLGILLKIFYKPNAIQLDYALDDEKNDEYNRRIGAWHILTESEKKWQIVHSIQNNNQKTNAGAGRNIERIIFTIEKNTPWYINTNVDTIQINLHSEVLIFLPDKVFIIKNEQVKFVNYEDVRIRTSQTQFIEHDTVPKDASVVGSTWRYVNSNGTPDRRYSDNMQLPICLYGAVYVSSNSGLNVEMQFSNVIKTQDFDELIK